MSVASPKSGQGAWREYMAWRRYGSRPAREFSLRERAQFAVASAGVRLYATSVVGTAHVDVSGDDSIRMNIMRGNAEVIWLMWHNRMPGFFLYYDRMARRNPLIRVSCIVSPSKDGELLARPLRETGGGELRGSSSRQGMRALREAMRGDASIATVGDGPRGPRYELKAGPILLARTTGMPIVVCSWACSRVAQLYRSWDQMMLPLPFSSLSFRFEPPVHVPADANDNDIVRIRRELQASLMRLTEWADAETRVAWPFPRPRPGEVLKRRNIAPIAERRR